MIKRFRPFGVMRTVKLRREKDGFALLVIMPFNNISDGVLVTDVLTFMLNHDFTATETSTRITGRASAEDLRTLIDRHVKLTSEQHLGVPVYLDMPPQLADAGTPSTHDCLETDMIYEPHVNHTWRNRMSLHGSLGRYRSGCRILYPVTRRQMIPKLQGSAAT